MPIFAQGTIDLDVPREKAEAFFTTPPEGIEIKGTLWEGEFKGHGIEAVYRASEVHDSLRIHITVTKKPFIATMKMIENKLKEFLLEEG